MDELPPNVFLLRAPKVPISTKVEDEQPDQQQEVNTKKEPLWFTDNNYRPCPEYDITVGQFVFRYRHEYEVYFIERGEVGESLKSIAIELGVPWAVMRHWAKQLPELAVAMEMSYQASQRYWEKVGKYHIAGRSEGFNVGGWLKLMSTQFPDSWHDYDDKDEMTDNKPVITDPFGFDSQDDELNTDRILEKLLRLKKDSEEEVA